jgi:putative ABC transport system permease protein
MIKNYLTIAIRNLKKRTTFSLINISGLAMGICACLVILHYMDFETSYDKFNKNADAILRVHRTIIKSGEQRGPIVVSTYGLGPALQSEIPEVKRYVRTHWEHSVVTYHLPSGDSKAFHENNILAADSTFFDTFTFRAISGSLSNALDDPNSIVLTNTVAKKYFGHEYPIGKELMLAGGRLKGTYTVTAVMEDVPQNSHLTFNVLVPMHNMLLTGQYSRDDGWGSNNFTTYIELKEQATAESVEEKLPGIGDRWINPKWEKHSLRQELHLQPLLDIHLHPGMLVDVETVSRSTIYFFGLIAGFILLIAWINYINLSTARAMERAREVGIKKAIGALRAELITQFFTESALINLMAMVVAFALTAVLLPVMGDIIGKNLVFAYSDASLWFILAVLFVVGTLASGIYPALVLSGLRITQIMKGQRQNSQGISLRQGLVVFQFAASLILMAGTFVVYRQIDYMKSRDKGLQMDQMLIVSGPGTLEWDAAQKRIGIFKEKVAAIRGVNSVATSGSVPGNGINWGADVRKLGSELSDIKLGSVVYVDPDFVSCYNISFVSGRNFNWSRQSDRESVIINEASLKAFDLGTAEEALGERLIMETDTVNIVGVLKNYNWASLKSEVVPFIFAPGEVIPPYISIHLSGGAIPESIATIGELYKGMMPDEPFEYAFLDDSFNQQYKSDQQFGNIFGVFAGLAVAISCLGLWGLASFTTAQKLKEIGIRKVLGASVSSIVYLLSSRFIRLIVISASIAVPVAWYGMNKWLNSFAFNAGIKWDLFVLPLVMLLFIALITVSVQVLKGAITNPAKILRSE